MAAGPKVLVVRVGRGGDLVMITPALRALLSVRPEAEIHLLTAAEGARVLRGFDERLTRTWSYHRRFPGRLWLQWQLGSRLRAENYDLILCFETRPFYRRWLHGLASCYSLDQSPPTEHFSAACLDLVEAALGEPVPRGWIELPVSGDGRARARTLLAEHGVGPEQKLVGLQATFSGSRVTGLRDRHGRRHRHWPAGSYSALARDLAARAHEAGLPLTIVIDALPEERPLVQPIVDAAGDAVTLLIAPPDFERYKGMLAELDVLVSPNTGPMHIAAAVGTDVVALFSGWSPADCGPYVPAEKQTVLMPPPDDERLAAITPGRVADAVWERL